MAELPTGTVTFLFTDIEGSTTLWEQHRDAMRQALVRHDALVEKFVTEYEGNVVRPRGEGDSRFAVFARASDAVAAAAALQQALHVEPWPTPTPLRVRMALHTGEADLRDGDYYGSAVNRAARLRVVAHGEQTLVSLTTEQLVRGQLTGGVELRDLGVHRLKDLTHPDRVFQLLVDGVPSDFPPLQTLDARHHNLPLQPTSFIGRENEIEMVHNRLLDPQVRLLTLTGAGGVGKTRLAMQVAAELLDHFPDGVWLVELAPTHDPALIGSAIAAALGVKESATQPVSDSLKLFLRDRRLLLVLDNFEQALEAGPLVGELLQAAPGLKVLVTSRAALHLRGEHEVPVRPLPFPTPSDVHDYASLSQYAAVELFIQRALAVNPEFAVTNATAPAVAEICVRLDGLPLAIELAAARSKMLAPQALLSRLQNRLKLLTGGARDLPARQQTIRGTIDWSFGLLNEAEQRLFTRLGVFMGGWTVEAAEVVCDADGDLGIDVLDGLQSLLDKSLLRKEEGADGEPRFRRLETIREYALERLAASGEGEVLRERHAAYYVALAERAEPELHARQQAVWMTRLEQEHNNMRAVLAWSLAAGGRQVELGMRLAAAVWDFWSRAAHAREGRRWLAELLARSEGDATHPEGRLLRARALSAAGALAAYQGDSSVSQPLLEEGLALFQALGNTSGMATVLMNLGVNRLEPQGDLRQALTCLEEGLALFQAIGDRWGIAWSLVFLANPLFYLVNSDAAPEGSGRAQVLLEESLVHFREIGDIFGTSAALNDLATVMADQGDHERVRVLLVESLALSSELGNKQQMVGSLIGFAELAAQGPRRAAAERASRLYGAVGAQIDAIGSDQMIGDQNYRDRQQTLARLREGLGEARFVEAWAEGRAMTLEQAVAYALQETADG